MLALNYNLIATAGAVIGFILLVVLIIEVFILRSKLNRLNKKYKYFMGGHDGVSVERQLSAEIKQLRDMVSTSEGMLHQQELLANMQLESFQRMGLVNYDAFDSTGDKLSFSLTLLNGRNNGFVFSCLTGSGTARIYAKKVTAGRCRESLSSEEAESIEMALNTKMPNVVLKAQEQAARREEEREKKTRKEPRKREHHENYQRRRTPAAPKKEEVAERPAAPAMGGNEPLEAAPAPQAKEVHESATEADISIFSSHRARAPRRGQYKVNHEERNK